VTRSANRQRLAAIVLATCLMAAGIAGLVHLYAKGQTSLLERLRNSGELRVATRRSPTTYHAGANGPDGFEYALIKRFAGQLGVEARFTFPSSLDELLNAAARGSVHMSAGGLSVTPERRQRLTFTTPYDTVTEQLLYRRGNKRPRDLSELTDGDLHVVARSSHEETLRELRSTSLPSLTWKARDDNGIDRLLAELDVGELRYTVADSNEAALSRRLYKHAAVAFDIGDPKPLAWAFGKGTDDSLLTAANEFLRNLDASGELRRLRARYFGHTGRLNFVDTREFWRHVRDRLPHYRTYFERAGEATGIDWRLLAAIGYQESHWRPKAVSPTGVRGIMMLTRSTAKQMGITDRNDPEQSIMGGARYLRVVEKKIPERIKHPNRLWLTLAGYNIGFGHLEDARILTQRDGANPDLWMHVKRRLPLLSKKKHHQTVRYGFARGREPVTYVDNIRNYYDMLVWFTTTADDEMRQRLLARNDD